ncbi:unnamed protein product [Orchesella dallaii]|uniref:Uncharacterized protein n=1 Tax=Orchesella dallaii TaxID=48710 RepID=A0ABP1SAB3_9HEXA
MMRDIIPNNNNADDDSGQFYDEIANVLVDIEQPEDYGSPVRGHIAEAYVKTVTRPLSKETSDKLKHQIKIPENCKQFRVPRMN